MKKGAGKLTIWSGKSVNLIKNLLIAGYLMKKTALSKKLYVTRVKMRRYF